MSDTTRKPGRPEKPPSERRSEVLYLKLTPAEKQLVSRVFAEPSVVARELILRAARRKEKE